MDKRFIQAHREVRWTLGLTLLYLLVWSLAAYLADSVNGITGLPHCFEMACLLVPLGFIALRWLMVQLVFRNISLEDGDAN
ncbi:YhdT family protein [Serratia symbiotica]|uniref:YhdT family protein n=1 Tax=Serratia symbiotica TaxID=138074 RepID=UPI001DC5AA3F|nr:YhdT family protein [Serratia symbiotica]NIG87553.1 YhdT family protein [Serratia symbiotica]USS96825.1 YhdT family protein [Serratia symbiotica]